MKVAAGASPEFSPDPGHENTSYEKGKTRMTPNKNYKFTIPLLKPALMMICLFVLTSITAMAQAPCTPVDIAPPADPALLVFEVEGKIQSYNNTARTITANGMTIFIPTTVLVETRKQTNLLPRRARFNLAANQLTPTDLLIDSWLKVAAVPDIDSG
jgi:hypothetical protein